MNSLKDKAAKGLFWGALNNGATQLLNAVFGIVIARILSEEDYGLIGMLNIFCLISASLQESGFVTALTNKKDASHRDYNSAFWFNVCVSFCICIILFCCAPLISAFYNEPLLTSLSRYLFFGIFISSFSIVPRALLFRQLKQKEMAIMGLTSLLISGAVGITMACMGMAYWGLATQAITFNLCVSILSWILSGWKPTFDISFQPIREMFGFSSKMLITNIFIHINNNIFSIILGKFYNKSEVGYYNQANKWDLMGANTITGMVQGVAQPTFVQVGEDKERLCRTFRKMLRFTSFVSFPLMFGLALIAPEFIVLLIKEKWLPSAHLMQILCIGGAFLPIATLYTNLIISRGKSNIYMWNVMVQSIIILTIVLGIISIFGESGCPLSLFCTLGYGSKLLSSILSYSTIDIMIVFYVIIIISWIAVWHHFLKKEIGISYLHAFTDIAPFVLFSAATMGVTYFITASITNLILLLVSRIVLAALVYIGILYLLGANILRECLNYILKKK